MKPECEYPRSSVAGSSPPRVGSGLTLSQDQQRWAFWLWGPGLGLLLLLAAVLVNSESSYFVVSFVCAVGFGVIAPLVQALLLNLTRFHGGRQGIVTVAFAAVVGLVCFALLAATLRAP